MMQRKQAIEEAYMAKIIKLAEKPKKSGQGLPKTPKSQMTPEEKKVLRTILAQEPVYEDVALNKLQIDYTYQDRPRQLLTTQIAYEFSPVMFGILIVSKRPDGSLYVCDGATRKLAMEMRNEGDRTMRCQIIETDGIKQEALLFKHYNKERKQVPLANRLNAEGIGGVDHGFRKLILQCGFHLIGASKTVLKGIYFVRKAYDLDDSGTALQSALFAIKAAWNGKHRVDGSNVLGIALLIHSQVRPIDEQLRRVLERTDPVKLDEQVHRMWGGGRKIGTKLRTDDRPRFVARALAQIINKNPGRSSKIEIDRIDLVQDVDSASA